MIQQYPTQLPLTADQRADACAVVSSNCDPDGRELFSKIVTRANECGGEYLATLDTWLVEGCTLRLRDKLASPFGGQTGWKEKNAHFNAWADIDTAGLKARDPNYGKTPDELRAERESLQVHPGSAG